MKTDDLLDLAVTEDCPDRLWSAAVDWLENQGFDKVLHLSLDPSGGVRTRTTLGRAFEQYYQAEGFAKSDPFLRHCLPAPGPVATGVAYLEGYDYLLPEESRVIAAAGDAGFQAGFSVVVRRGARGCEAWNLGSSLGRAEVERIRSAQASQLRAGLMVLRDRLAPPAWSAAPAGPPAAPSPAAVALSPQQRACLDLLSQGLRSKAIAAELGLAVVTVDLHLRNARTRLGAATRDQALMLYRAARGGRG